MRDYEGSMDDWFGFMDETETYYWVDMSVLTKPFSEEQKKNTIYRSVLYPEGSKFKICRVICDHYIAFYF